MLNIFKYALSPLIFLLLTACGNRNKDLIANNAALKFHYIQTTPFKLASYQRIKQFGAPINIYLEGDGKAWINRHILSRDPSPRKPLVLQLAALDPNPNIVYLARPCQYSPADLTSVCDSKYWSLARYSEPVINSINQAISKIKSQTHANEINLIGFSGGATIAVLISARRNDINSIRTIAGNLDLTTMHNYHQTTPLSESLDPINVAIQIKHIPQLHFVGKKDKTVPVIIAKNFCHAAGLDSNKIIILNKASHNTGWEEEWLTLLNLPCENLP